MLNKIQQFLLTAQTDEDDDDIYFTKKNFAYFWSILSKIFKNIDDKIRNIEVTLLGAINDKIEDLKTSISEKIEDQGSNIDSIVSDNNERFESIEGSITTINATLSGGKKKQFLCTIDDDGNIAWKDLTVDDVDGALSIKGGTINGDLNITGNLTQNGDKINVNVFHIGTTAPENTEIFWIDTNSATNALKYYNGTSWVYVPVAYT